MAKKSKKSGMTAEEGIVVAEFVEGVSALGKFLGGDDELPCIEDIGFDAQLKLLKGIHSTLGDDKLESLIQVLQMANDGDFRCPK